MEILLHFTKKGIQAEKLLQKTNVSQTTVVKKLNRKNESVQIRAVNDQEELE